MKTFEYSGAKSIVVSGDIHGEFAELVFRRCECGPQHQDVGRSYWEDERPVFDADKLLEISSECRHSVNS